MKTCKNSEFQRGMILKLLGFPWGLYYFQLEFQSGRSQKVGPPQQGLYGFFWKSPFCPLFKSKQETDMFNFITSIGNKLGFFPKILDLILQAKTMSALSMNCTNVLIFKSSGLALVQLVRSNYQYFVHCMVLLMYPYLFMKPR